MNDPQALFYLLPYTTAAVAVANIPENAHYFVDAGKVNEPVAREEQALPLETDKRHTDSDSLDPELEASDADTGAVTREGTPTTSNSTYRDKVLRFGFDGIVDANGFLFGRDPDSHLLLVQPGSQGDLHNYGISRVHFRIHFNLENGMLMLTDSSTFGTLVGRARLKRESTPLLSDTTVYCGQERRLGFLIQLQDYTGHEEIYAHNYQMYVAGLGRSPNLHLPTPGPTPQLRNVGTDYSILATVAKGSYGHIHTVLHRKRGRVYAAKEISCAKNDGRTVMPLEVVIFSKVSHPHIVQYEETIIWANNVFVVMEYLPMGNLQQYREAQPNGRLLPMCVRSILNQSLQALRYLHDSRIMHRDIKPENVLVATGEPLIKLADFGLSSLQRLPESFCGTPDYVAPEVYKGRDKRRRTYSNSVDIWALGVVAYQLLGCLPKGQKKNQLRWYHHIRSSLEPKQQPIFLLLKRMLVEDPLQRLSASQCLQDSWFQGKNRKSTDQQSKKRLNPFSPTESHRRPAQSPGPSTVTNDVPCSTSSSSTEILLEEFHTRRSSDHHAQQNHPPPPQGPAHNFWITWDKNLTEARQDRDRTRTGAPLSSGTHHRTHALRDPLFGEIQ